MRLVALPPKAPPITANICCVLRSLIALGIFNLIPVPPLDGSTVLAILCRRTGVGLNPWETHRMFFILFMVLWNAPY